MLRTALLALATLVALPSALREALAAAPVAAPQQAPVSARLRVFVESCNCFEEFLRTEIRWVDFVRQREEADIQILSASQQTGAGGTETVLRFVGLGRFAPADHALRVATPPGEPEDVRRRDVLRTVLVGLLGFAGRDGLPSGLDVEVTAERNDAGAPQVDPWNYWVFSVGAQGGFRSEESNREETWDFSASADRVTERWRVSFGGQLETEKETFDLEDEGQLTADRREGGFSWFIARALGEHWSAGLDGDVESSTFGNVKVRTEVMPAIEFNLFPYSQYASRQLRFEYGIGVQQSQYDEITLFGLRREMRPVHEISATLDQREPWGTLQAGLEWSQYLHDLSKNRLEFETEINLRIVRGLSLQIEGTASRIRDQISLPRRDATSEEVLLRLRELQSGHDVQISVGVTYSFGSIFNNIVNPRFGRN